MSDDDWITLAMADDSLVVDLLLRLHRSHLPTTTTPSPPPPRSASAVCLQLGWTVRQRRSRLSASSRHLAAGKKAEPTRASPTTPLSWSCVTSGSCGGGAVDGYEESSLFYFTKPMETSRSDQVANPSEISMTKRARKRKTLVELKEEENFLLKERKNLKNELASLRLTVEKHRATNESLKRMKLDLESGKAFKAACMAIGEAVSHPSDAVSAASITHKVLNDAPSVCLPNASSKTQEILNNLESSFLLPDLNLPIEEDLS